MPGEMESCKICGSGNIKTKSVYGVSCCVCGDCGITYKSGMPSAGELEAYYSSQYKITSSAYALDYEATEKRRFFRLPEQYQLLSMIGQYKMPPALIADIGCDKGFFLDEARRRGYAVTGAEPSESGRRYAGNIGIELHRSIDELPAGIDIAVMWHSLEHFTEPYDILAKIKSRLNPGGMLFVRVPDFDNAWRRLFGKRWVWFQPENHYYHYNIQSLRTLLQKSGFDVMHIERRKPNNRHTNRAYRAASPAMSAYFGLPRTLRSIVRKKYEDIVGIEIFAAARIAE